MKKLKIGFIGAGNVVRTMHAPVLAGMGEFFEVAGFADINPAAAGQLSADTGMGKGYGNFSSMHKDNPGLDVVVVATLPYSTHAPLAVEALEAGCSVCVEKPFATSSVEARRMFDAARKSGKSLCAYQNRRYEASFIFFRDAVEKGVVGAPRLLKRVLNRGAQPVEFLNMGSHIIDQMVCMTGGETPREVSAVIQDDDPGLANDGPIGFFKAGMRFESGLLAEVEYLPFKGQENYFYAAGTSGGFRMDWADNMADFFRKQMQPQTLDKHWADKCKPGLIEELFPGIFDMAGSLYFMCYRKLYEHLAEGGPPPVPEKDTICQLEIIESIIKSGREKRTVRQKEESI